MDGDSCVLIGMQLMWADKVWSASPTEEQMILFCTISLSLRLVSWVVMLWPVLLKETNVVRVIFYRS